MERKGLQKVFWWNPIRHCTRKRHALFFLRQFSTRVWRILSPEEIDLRAQLSSIFDLVHTPLGSSNVNHRHCDLQTLRITLRWRPPLLH